MRTIRLTILAMLVVATTFGQYKVDVEVDDMSETTSYLPERVILSEDGVKGLMIQPLIDKERGKMVSKHLIVLHFDIGSGCVENSKLIILFEDGQKVNMTAWNSFNCEDTNYFRFDLTKYSSPIDKIKFTHGRDYDSFTYTLSDKESRYFIEINNAMQSL